MTEHTPTPWTWHAKSMDQAHNGSVYHMKMPGHAYAIAMQPRYVDDKQFAADAAFIVKAVNNHDALLEFFRWAMREGPWDGGDLDGGSVQDKAESLGLIVKTQYDAEKHGVQSEFETGDDWFEYAPDLRVDVGQKQECGE